MGIADFQDFLETECSSACVSVDLLKISRGFVQPKRRGGRNGGNGRFCLVVDAESCLDRLYGGFFSDWVCGGQWNRMTAFLTSLIRACHNANMELVVFFNGALEKEKTNEWYSHQIAQKDKVRYVLRHIANKGTPPPKVWWIPPVFLHGALRMALAHLGVTVACSMDDHHQEVIGFCREHNLQGIIAQESVYTIFDPPRYFSSNNLKLTYKGSLETKEYIMDEIAKCLNLNPNRFSIFAALLGNHILTDEDLQDFRSQFPSQDTKQKRGNGKLDSNTIKTTCDFVRNLQAVDNLDQVGELVFSRTTRGNKAELTNKFKQCVQYYLNGTEGGFLKYRPRFKVPGVSRHGSTYSSPGFQNGQRQQENFGAGDSGNQGDGPQGRAPGAFPSGEFSLPTVTTEIIRIASERHQKGLMHPMIYQLLTQGEVKLDVILEDETNRELPSYIDLYRPIRQTIYSVLFNLNKLKIIHENTHKEKGEAPPPKSFEVNVKEWIVRRSTQRPTFEVTIAKPVEWKTPSIERMWLGKNAEDKNRRLRAFLTIMHSDTPLILNTQYVPQHLLVMCCVLRYIVQFGRVLQRQELDAFLAMAISPLLHDVQTMQDLKLPNIMPRGVQLASLFMAGVEIALAANDVCGAPVPAPMCCPWLFFDGKLFHFKLLKANNNTPLIDMCDGQVEQVLHVERLRQAILENIHVDFAKPLLPSALYPPYPPYGPGPGPYGPGPIPRGRGGPLGAMMGPPGPKSPGRGRGILGNAGRSPVDTRGGQLEIAGVVVGSWRGREGPSPHVRGMPGSQAFLPTRPIRGRPPTYVPGRGGYGPPPVRGLYAPRGGRGLKPIRRPVRLTVRPGRGRGAKTVSKGRGVTIDSSATSSQTKVSGSKEKETVNKGEQPEVFDDAEEEEEEEEDGDYAEEEEEEEEASAQQFGSGDVDGFRDPNSLEINA
ncbi:constitutive coactivator of PPAR-gamma-like protein 1 homolog isoform X2 [Pomacea canaliculata]|uniref:constitutive coactivator of PPAR-gamma-like protein 1 homolog isoform X2 n=1 Tax=Pomacea canaliculata TaxID=400727 RepID=UPI000D73F62C|nr:constitutive coactivator of PPAR-gamma-like protein 1 homolog isoform X2 [Pomacea canaliculata]